MKKIRNTLSTITRLVSWIGVAATFFLMMVTTVDVILRSLPITASILGAYDIAQLTMVVLVFFGIAYLQGENGHIRVDMFVNKLPHGPRYFLMGLVNLAEGCFGAMLCYASYQQVSTLMNRGSATQVISVPQWPFAGLMALSLLLFTLLVFCDALIDFTTMVKGPTEAIAQELPEEA